MGSWHNYAAARALRRRMTPTERLAWELLRGRRFHGLKFYRQRPWGRYVLDFYCPALHVALEIDGDVHGLPERARADSERQRTIERAGVRFARVTAEAIGTDPNAALELALAPFMRGHTPAPPLHPGGEGQG